MLRKKLFGTLHNEQFRHRTHEIVRVEALSDAVFAFSVSLLVAALEVPQTFEELRWIINGAIPFFCTVALVFMFWYQQNVFFRHYGVNDLYTIVLNLVYLAVILFYVYPLKFLFSLLLSSWTGLQLFPKAAEKHLAVISQHEFPALIIIFSAGYFVIWLLLFLMHKHVLRFSSKLELNRYETAYTKKETRGALWNALTGLVAILFALIGWELVSGLCYLFIPVLLFINNRLFAKQLR